MTKVRVGAVQAEPGWLDLGKSVDKTISLIQQASEDGVNVLGFPEVWIPGYPWSLWTKSVLDNTEMVHKYMANSLVRDSPEMRRIQQAAKAASMVVVLGYSERDGASLYMGQSFISQTGEIVHHRRKIKPTHVERTLWGEGQAESLKTVIDTPFGKVGGLNCWEHLQPLLRYYEYAQGVQIHIASWPAEFCMPDPAVLAWQYHETGEASYRASQFMAIEGQTFVIAASQILTEQNLELNNLTAEPPIKTPGGGFSMIFGPDGKPLVKALTDGEEGILVAAHSLKAAILALCAFHLGYHEDALQYKARSLHSLELSLRVERSDSMSAQVAACMMLCVYGVFDMSDGNWVVHLRGAKGIVEKYHQCAELSSFLRSWLLYHEVLSQFSLKIRGDENLHPVPEPMEDKTVIIGSLGCSEELMELIACINSIPNTCPDEDYIQTVGLRLGSISQIIVIKEEDHNLVYPSSIDIHRIQVTAEFYHVAALLYFHHHVQRLASKHPTIKALVRSALNLISQMGVCTSPWPLFVVACEVTEDAERLQILDTFAGMEQHRRIGNISATRMIVETLWKQHDLADDDLARPNIDWRSIVDMKTISPSFI